MLEAVAPTTHDQLVFLGDYIDRGPGSREVVQRLMDLRETLGAVTILGNHEEMMLRALKGQASLGWWLRYGGVETLESYGAMDDLTKVPYAHMQFLESCVGSYVRKDFFFVHANYVPDELLTNQPAEALRWQSLDESFPGPHVSGRTAIVGHTSQKSGEILDEGYLRCIDTYCHGGGWLTAMDVDTKEVWQADRQGRMR